MMCPICSVGLGQVAQSLENFHHPKDDVCVLGGVSASKKKWKHAADRMNQRIRQRQAKCARRIIELIEDEMEV